MLGKEIYHAKYGRGIVRQTRYKGFELQIIFEDGITRWVRVDEISNLYENHVQPGLKSDSPTRAFSENQFKARRMIEAFRLGVVPYDCIEEFTFGREAELAKIEEWLEAPDEGVLMVVGRYGSGKSHLLHYVQALALRKGFAAARVELDPNEAPFHKPKRVYSKLVQSLKYYWPQNNTFKSFRDLVKAALSKGLLVDHLYYKQLIGNEENELFWEWIEGRESNIKPLELIEDGLIKWFYYKYVLPSLYDYGLAANIYCYLLSAIGWAAEVALGLKGLLLIFDEAESIDMVTTLSQKRNAKNFLDALIDISDNRNDLLGHPRFTKYNFCKVSAARDVPFLYRLPSNIKLILSFAYQKESSRPRIDLEPLNEAAREEVIGHICSVYEKAYSFPLKVNIRQKLAQKINSGMYTRSLVKTTVEILDLFRFRYSQGFQRVS